MKAIINNVDDVKSGKIITETFTMSATTILA